jgi:hypothetical protein
MKLSYNQIDAFLLKYGWAFRSMVTVPYQLNPKQCVQVSLGEVKITTFFMATLLLCSQVC